MRKLKRVNINIQGEEFSLTPKQLFIKLRKLNIWSMQSFLENNSTDLFNDFKHKDRIIEEIENIHGQLESDRNEKKLNMMELDRQEERSNSNLNQSIYPHGWYEKQDNQIIKGDK